MKRGMAVLRRACLTLGLLMALGGSAWAIDGCPPPNDGGIMELGEALVGTTGNCFSFSLPGTLVLVVQGGNPNFTVASNCPLATACSGIVCFTPTAQACGEVTGTLAVMIAGAMCPITLIGVRGFACSFDCAITTTQSGVGAGTLSSSGGNLILRELVLAQATSGSTRCGHLNCALCLAQAELARGRTGAQAVVRQISCLLHAFCVTP